jgi:CBS domain-containing protein
MLVRDVMQRNVIVAKENIKIKEAAEIMSKYRIGSLMIVRDNLVVGILTEGDILKAIAKGFNPEVTEAKEVMTKEVITISSTAAIEEAAKLMLEKKIKKLPVVDGDKLVGIITATDIAVIQPKLIKNLAELLSTRIPFYKTGG